MTEIQASAQNDSQADKALGNEAEIRLWILRLLVPSGGHRQFVEDKCFAYDCLASWLGFDDMLQDGGKRFDRQLAISRLQVAWQEAESLASENPPEDAQSREIWLLGRQLGLNETETDVLRFRLECERNRWLRVMMRIMGRLALDRIVEILATCLKRPETDIRRSLAVDSALITSGVIALQILDGELFNLGVSLMNCIAEEIGLAHKDPILYFRSRLVRSAPPRLTESDYPHVVRDVAMVRQFVADALANRQPGVNVLIHGVPGSGKTELVRLLAMVLDVQLYEVATVKRDGNLLRSLDRLRAYRLAQTLLRKSSRQMILFDEIEDVFQENDRGLTTAGNNSGHKGAINKLLESNPVPAFWVTNNIQVIDRAFLRRFDYVLELNAPPRSVRARVLDQYLDGLPVSTNWKRRMAEHEDLVPAIVERAAKVVQTGVGKELPSQEVEFNLSRILGNTLEAMGLPREPRYGGALDEGYRIDVLNTDCDLAAVRAGLAEHRQGRLCLYGPPGTGKTAFGRYISEALDRPLMVKRASDIVSCWVGVTERNMARMFRAAQEEGAVLLLDEADSFLRDRQGARQSWEVTEVNEMLAQMECFEGLFIASTNLMDSLDAAALRRFDLKIRFDFLKPEQACALFHDAAQRLGLDVPKDIEARLAGLDCLTPGDFANVARQARLRRIASASELLARLAAECTVKPEGKRRPMGFAVV